VLIDTRLTKLGIESTADAALYVPESYRDYRLVIDNFDPYLLPVGQEAIYKGRLIGEPKTIFRNGKPLTLATISDGRHSLKFSLFGDHRETIEKWSKSDILTIKGTANRHRQETYLNNVDGVKDIEIGRITPVYPGKSKVVRSATMNTLLEPLLADGIPKAATHLVNRVREALPEHAEAMLNNLTKGASVESVLWMIHRPRNESDVEQACEALENLSTLVLAADVLARTGTKVRERGKIFSGRYVGALAKKLPFELTDEQKKCVRKAMESISSGYRFKGLLIGDVGSGKTATFLLIAACILAEGGRVSVLLPNGAIAEQIYHEFNDYFGSYFSSLLVTNQTPAGRELDHQLLVGTTAMLFREVGEFDLCIIDEQQKLSVEQREALSRGKSHMLEVSATPIPRSMALATHGAVETLTIRNAHVPKSIRTIITRKAQARLMLNHVQETISRGEKVFIMCPRRDGSSDDNSSLASVIEVAQKFERHFPGMVRIAHSGLSDEENQKALTEMKDASGNARILVATSLIEVGITIKGLSLGIVHDASRFGLQTLHQARGRLGRFGEDSTFYLYLPKEKVSDATLERLNILTKHLDGFAVSEEDMRIRGIGDVHDNAQRQHGTTESLIRNIPVNIDRLAKAIEFLRNQEVNEAQQGNQKCA